MIIMIMERNRIMFIPIDRSTFCYGLIPIAYRIRRIFTTHYITQSFMTHSHERVDIYGANGRISMKSIASSHRPHLQSWRVFELFMESLWLYISTQIAPCSRVYCLRIKSSHSVIFVFLIVSEHRAATVHSLHTIIHVLARTKSLLRFSGMKTNVENSSVFGRHCFSANAFIRVAFFRMILSVCTQHSVNERVQIINASIHTSIMSFFIFFLMRKKHFRYQNMKWDFRHKRK